MFDTIVINLLNLYTHTHILEKFRHVSYLTWSRPTKFYVVITFHMWHSKCWTRYHSIVKIIWKTLGYIWVLLTTNTVEGSLSHLYSLECSFHMDTSGLSKCKHDTWQTFEIKNMINLCRNREPSTVLVIVDYESRVDQILFFNVNISPYLPKFELCGD